VYDHVIRLNGMVDVTRELLASALEANLSLISVPSTCTSSAQGSSELWPLSRRAIARVLFLESEILGRQTKLGAAEDDRGLLGVVAHVRPHGMDIAPGSLDGITEKDDPAAAGL
jgi:hypothetical protein